MTCLTKYQENYTQKESKRSSFFTNYVHKASRDPRLGSGGSIYSTTVSFDKASYSRDVKIEPVFFFFFSKIKEQV